MLHLEDIHLEALLEAGYVAVLVVVALGLEQLARIAQRRSEGFETAGFHYDAALDAWECPTGERLLLVGIMNDDRRIARYRARPAVCNRCPIKAECTDSYTGRELERTLDDWPRSEITRFYRGLAFTLVVLATFIGCVGLVRNQGLADVLVLGGVLILVACVAQRMIVSSRLFPTNSGPATDVALPVWDDLRPGR
jgi:hypothetical protein